MQVFQEPCVRRFKVETYYGRDTLCKPFLDGAFVMLGKLLPCGMQFSISRRRDALFL
jgi:hypothetical protein